MRVMSVVGAALAVGVLLGSCKKSGTNSPDCDTEIRYDARKVSGRIAAGKFGVETDTSVAAVREVDSAVERYVSRWRTLCIDYKNGAMTQGEYRDESRALRERMERLEGLLLVLEHAPDAASYQKALKDVYVAMVPPEKAVDLRLEFGAMAQKPGEQSYTAVPVGGAIATGTNVYFDLKTSEQAHIYIYQETPAGKINVMFPHPQMPMANPLPAGQTLRIPPSPGYFTLEAEGVGSEQVHIVASLEPLTRLETSMSKQQPTAAELACGARDLSYNPGTQCDEPQARTFGLAQPGNAPGVSMTAANTAGARSIHQIFTFNHTP
ncbi:MAG: DUF4384 domain-containing protein [Myxococcales bacterium]|nr:DUF4384 domain-containing protein [Myxococcales bacterium]